jgi:hypothetical protein
MGSQNFLEACEKAQEMVSGLPDQTYRAAAFQVVLGKLWSNSDSEVKPASQNPTHKPAGGDLSDVKSDTQRRILELREDGFFREPRLPGDVQNELRTQGFHHNAADVRMALLRLAKKKLLRRIQEAGNHYRYTSI